MEIKITQKLIKCRQLSPQALIVLESCQKCKYYLKTEEIMAEANNRPAVLEIVCSLPSRVRVEYQIEVV